MLYLYPINEIMSFLYPDAGPRGERGPPGESTIVETSRPVDAALLGGKVVLFLQASIFKANSNTT